MKLLRNEDIESALLAAPSGHRHLRLAIRTKDGETIVLQEATVAAIVRAYTAIKTHPTKQAIKMISKKPEGLKKGYAADQLIEVEVDDGEVIRELTELLGK